MVQKMIDYKANALMHSYYHANCYLTRSFLGDPIVKIMLGAGAGHNMVRFILNIEIF